MRCFDSVVVLNTNMKSGTRSICLAINMVGRTHNALAINAIMSTGDKVSPRPVANLQLEI